MSQLPNAFIMLVLFSKTMDAAVLGLFFFKSGAAFRLQPNDDLKKKNPIFYYLIRNLRV